MIRGERVLITRRPAGTHLEGLWEFPGGKIEPGETPAQAIARELDEELEIVVRVGPRWGVLLHRYREKAVRLHFHFAELVSGEPRPVGVSEVRWVDRHEIESFSFPEADRPLVAALASAGEGKLTDLRRDEEPGETA